jgi:hypothetical protein
MEGIDQLAEIFLAAAANHLCAVLGAYSGREIAIRKKA